MFLRRAFDWLPRLPIFWPLLISGSSVKHIPTTLNYYDLVSLFQRLNDKTQCFTPYPCATDKTSQQVLPILETQWCSNIESLRTPLLRDQASEPYSSTALNSAVHTRPLFETGCHEDDTDAASFCRMSDLVSTMGLSGQGCLGVLVSRWSDVNCAATRNALSCLLTVVDVWSRWLVYSELLVKDETPWAVCFRRESSVMSKLWAVLLDLVV